jgi:hypothetical protein
MLKKLLEYMGKDKEYSKLKITVNKYTDCNKL